MASNSNGRGLAEFKQELPTNLTENDSKGNSDKYAVLDVSTSRKGLLSDDRLSMEKQNALKVVPSRLNILKLSSNGDLSSPSAKFKQIVEERDEISRSVRSSTSQGFRGRFNGFIGQKIDWESLWSISRIWIKNPFNMVLFLWIFCVAVSGAILFLVMTGILDTALPKKSQRDAWFEVNNQILNALFTLMCLYQHPKRFYYLVLLIRWRPKDITKLRKIYCKNGTYKPHEWAHMMVVVMLLHLNCFAQYALCSLNLGYRRSERPAIGVGICISVAIAAPAVACLYTIISPLGKEYDYEFDEEAQSQTLTNGTSHLNCRMSLEKRFSFASRDEQRIVEYAPEWRGGLFDIWHNIRIAYLSLFCSFCVFGWNMERLGFGNMYVHIATFLLFCTAPFWIFNLAAINIDNEGVRVALGLTGIMLCLFGLLYGGFWRIQMRKRFNLPASNIFCGKPAIADCTQWLFCCWCSLAQEVRTADFYDIVEDKFCWKQTSESKQPTLSPLPREDGVVQFISSPTSFQNSHRLPTLGASHSLSPSRLSKDHYSPGRQFMKVEEDFSMKDAADNFRKPPALSSIRKEFTNQNILRENNHF
ncbi:unnamed protein product [Dovyalis caffra]|uniref:PLAC8 motif-containing protein n=1 Tax=Dovyalis caffra TaxID=77055 RepID=A0AAV1S149_9ROSI|nr:unnamed protein product [Dovyalis caffra]